MSYKQRDRDSSRHSSSRRMSRSPPRHRRESRRSPSPGPSRSRPRDPKNLPESFGRIQDMRADDDLTVLQRMKTAYKNSPLADLYVCVNEKKKVKIWTRNYKEVRGVMTGYIKAFDKHWNLILHDVDEVYLKHKKSKTPFLREVAANENLPDMPVKEQKKKPEAEKTDAEKTQTTECEPTPPVSEEKTEKPEKKKKRKKRSKTTSEKRQVDQLFIRGDNVVMICPLDEEETVEEDNGDGEEEAQESG